MGMIHPRQLGLAIISMTMDMYEHVLKDLHFNGRKVELLEAVKTTGRASLCYGVSA
jgi:hypothetical protein